MQSGRGYRSDYKHQWFRASRRNGRSGCSALKGSGSNQDPKRTDGSKGYAREGGAEPATPFEESLHSTIKDQESIHEQHKSAGEKSAKNTHAAGHHRAKPVTGKTASNSTSENEASQNQQPDAEQSALTAIDPNAVAAVPGATLTSLVAILQFGGSADGGSPFPAVSAAASDSKSGAINAATVPASVNLDSQIQDLKGDRDTLVFDGTLHPAAPAQPQTALPGAGKSAWLLNAQPVYTAAGLANKAVDVPGPSRWRDRYKSLKSRNPNGSRNSAVCRPASLAQFPIRRFSSGS